MVDEEVVATKLERAHEYTNDLVKMRGLPKEMSSRHFLVSRPERRRGDRLCGLAR